MANEVAVPLLPCASIEEIATFYQVLGFHTTYQQRKPNPYVALQREDLQLHFFEIAGFDPEKSYGSCLVLTSDTGSSTGPSRQACGPHTARCWSPGRRG